MAWDPDTTDSQDWAERGLRMAADTTAGNWIVEHVHNFDHTVAALVPPVFPAYARIFHPANTLDDKPVRWADVAEANGTVAHPVMEWGSIVGSWHTSEQESLWHDSPARGSLPVRTTRALADLLRRSQAHRTTVGSPTGKDPATSRRRRTTLGFPCLVET